MSHVEHVDADAEGAASLQNALDAGVALLRHIPPYGQREILVCSTPSFICLSSVPWSWLLLRNVGARACMACICGQLPCCCQHPLISFNADFVMLFHFASLPAVSTGAAVRTVHMRSRQHLRIHQGSQTSAHQVGWRFSFRRLAKSISHASQERLWCMSRLHCREHWLIPTWLGSVD